VAEPLRFVPPRLNADDGNLPVPWLPEFGGLRKPLGAAESAEEYAHAD